MPSVGQRLEAVLGYISCWHKHGYSRMSPWVLYDMLSSAMCVFFIGPSFQAEHLLSLQVACNCLPGYSGDGVSQCNPINLCEQVCLHFAVSRGEGHSFEASLSPNS